MSRRKKVASVAFTGVAALGAVGFAAGHAHAAGVTKVVVTPGGKYTAKNKTGTTTTLTDNKTKAVLTCTKATAAGSLPGSPTGNKVGSVATGATFSSCSLLGLQFTATTTSPATLRATKATTAGGLTLGSLSGIHAKLAGKSGFSCSATFSGHLPGSYQNSSTLKIPGTSKTATLKVTHTNGACLGEINSGDSAYFDATYTVTPNEKVIATS